MSLELVHPTLVHPRTGEPLRALGVRANGDPIWPIMGGDGSEGDANDTGGDGDPNDQDQDTGNGDQDPDNDQDQDGDDEDARVKRANRQAANYRTQLRETQTQLQQLQQQQDQSGAVLEALRKALGGDGDGEDADPAEQVTQLTGQVENLTTTVQQQAAELQVYQLAGEANADAAKLLDSRAFADQLHKLDPDADDYRAQVLEAMKEAVSKNSAYRAGQGSSRGGAELDKREGRERQQRKAKGLRGAIGNHYGS